MKKKFTVYDFQSATDPFADLTKIHMQLLGEVVLLWRTPPDEPIKKSLPYLHLSYPEQSPLAVLGSFIIHQEFPLLNIVSADPTLCDLVALSRNLTYIQSPDWQVFDYYAVMEKGVQLEGFDDKGYILESFDISKEQVVDYLYSVGQISATELLLALSKTNYIKKTGG